MNSNPDQNDRATAPPSPTFIPAGRMGYHPGSDRAVAPNRKITAGRDDVELVPDPVSPARAPSKTMTGLWVVAMLAAFAIAAFAVFFVLGLSFLLGR